MASAGRTRILYVISGLTRGGAERQLYLLLKHMDRAAFEPAVVSLGGPGPVGEAIRDLGVPVTELPRRGRLEVRRLAALHRIVRAFRPHILQTFMLADTLYGFAAGRLAGVPVLLTSRRTDRYTEFPRLLRKLNEVAWRWADAIICPSHRAVSHVPARFAARHVVIPNGVEPLPVRRDRAAVRRSLGIAPDAFVVGTVGRLVPAKNHARFVEVAGAVAARRPDAAFLLVGGGQLEADIRAMVRERGLDGRVVMTGERTDVGDLLGAMDVFLLTSDREGLCNAVMEAMLAGVPCVVTDVGGNPELVKDGESGMVRTPAAPALAEAVLRLASNGSLRRSLGEAGRRRMEAEFGVGATTRATERLYRRLLAARVPRSPAPAERPAVEKVAR